MATLYTHQSKNITKTWLLMTAFFGLMIAIGFAMSVIFNNGLILIFASPILGYYLGDYIEPYLNPMFDKIREFIDEKLTK